jgi:regulator of sigma D
MSPEEQRQPERRGRTQEIINTLLGERRQLLVAFCQVAGLEPRKPNKPVRTLIREFCQVLMDYAAAVHFELYTRVAEGKERRGQVLKIAKESYPTIAAITQRAVDFNDKYDKAPGDPPDEAMQDDLSRLGEDLALRFELEDQLFKALLERG